MLKYHYEVPPMDGEENTYFMADNGNMYWCSWWNWVELVTDNLDVFTLDLVGDCRVDFNISFFEKPALDDDFGLRSWASNWYVSRND